jgi:hypothetical protein
MLVACKLPSSAWTSRTSASCDSFPSKWIAQSLKCTRNKVISPSFRLKQYLDNLLIM